MCFGTGSLMLRRDWILPKTHVFHVISASQNEEEVKGAAFKDFFELRDRIYDKKDNFARGYTEALIEYGLGRPFAFTDEDLANEMIKHSKTHDYSMSEFIHALVQSKQFKTK